MGAVAAVHLADRPGDREAVRRMLAVVPHRGTHQRVDAIGSTAIGICRDPAWPRAWMSRSQDVGIVAVAGVLDNGDELSERLSPPPSVDMTDPSQVVTAALRCWGLDAIRHLRGNFALVVSDGRTVWGARDHFGFRPLFVHHGPRSLVLASEVKQILAGTGMRAEPDLDHLERVMYGGVRTSTAYVGIERVPRGACTVLGDDGIARTDTYWDPGPLVETLDIDVDEARHRVVDHLERATHRMLSGYDAILLSGGLDSPAIAAFAATGQRNGRPVHALSGVYPDHPEVDERPWIEMVVRHLGMPLETYVPTAGALDDVDGWVVRLGGPVDTLSIPECADAYRRARELGARTVMTGELAENVFDGRAYLLDHLVAHARLRSLGRELRERRRHGHSWKGIVRTLVRAAAPAPLLNAHHRRHPRRLRTLPDWIDPGVIREQEERRRVASARSRWIDLQTASFTGSAIGYEADEICAAHCGVEIRRPFADVDLWEFALGLRAEVKSPPDLRSKALLREAVRPHLPDEIVDRRDKTVFDSYQLAQSDYPALRKWLTSPNHRVRGIDYERLAERLDAGDMNVIELHWARDLARVQAFAAQW